MEWREMSDRQWIFKGHYFITIFEFQHKGLQVQLKVLQNLRADINEAGFKYQELLVRLT